MFHTNKKPDEKIQNKILNRDLFLIATSLYKVYLPFIPISFQYGNTYYMWTGIGDFNRIIVIERVTFKGTDDNVFYYVLCFHVNVNPRTHEPIIFFVVLSDIAFFCVASLILFHFNDFRAVVILKIIINEKYE